MVKLTEGSLYYLVLAGLLLLNISIFLPPFLIFAGNEGAAALLYNLHNYDHQWIYRSQCVFKNPSGNLLLDDCIIQRKEAEANISTLYTTNGNPKYAGIFTTYPQSQIGSNKAEKVFRNGMVGYKFANDTRDYAIYLPWMLAMLAYPFVFGKGRKEMPHWAWFAVALIPLAIDGFTQLLAGMLGSPVYYWLYYPFGLQESTNLIRWVTGAIAGAALGVYTVPMLNGFSGNKKGGR